MIPDEQNKTETPVVILWKEEPLLCCMYKKGSHIDLETAKEAVQERLQFTENTFYLCLIDITGIKSMTADARAYLSKEGAEGIIAAAFLIGSTLSRMLGNIFLSINKPPIPVKMFTDEADARKWLLNLHSPFEGG